MTRQYHDPGTVFDPAYDYVEDPDEREAPVRATVTLAFEIRSRDPIPLPAHEIASWVADRLGRVTDNGPYELRHRFGPSVRFGGEVSFGSIAWPDDGAVEWLDGSAPPEGYHCSRCLTPKRGGLCMEVVMFRGKGLPCALDIDHHERCSSTPAAYRDAPKLRGPYDA